MSNSTLVFWRTVSLKEAEELCVKHNNHEQRPSPDNPGYRDIYIPPEELDYINLQCSSDI